MDDYYKIPWKALTIVGVVLGLTLGTGMAGCPAYNVWSAKMRGSAELARASQNRQIKIQEARALFESADYKARAEIRRAEGVAKANQIIGSSLKDNEAYLRYLYINNLADSHDQIIYVPTEAGLPILEAGRRPQSK